MLSRPRPPGDRSWQATGLPGGGLYTERQSHTWQLTAFPIRSGPYAGLETSLAACFFALEVALMTAAMVSSCSDGTRTVR